MRAKTRLQLRTLKVSDETWEKIKDQVSEYRDGSVRRKPKMGERYWRLGSGGSEERFRWNNDHDDRKLFKFGNCYRTRVLCLAAKKRVKKAHLEG